jgi:excisionase family DNA binding protein
MEPLIRATEVAPLLDIKVSTVYALAKRGVLPCVRVGDGRRPIVRFRKSEIESFARGHVRAAEPRR